MAETFAFLSFCAFLNLIIILIKENKKKLTLCQRNEQTLIQIMFINRHKNIIGSWRSTCLLPPQYSLILLVNYRQVSYANLWHSTCSVLAVNKIQILAINRHKNIIDSSRSTGLLLVQYCLQRPTFFRPWDHTLLFRRFLVH